MESEKRKIIVGRLWSGYDGRILSRSPVVLGMDPQRYSTVCIYLSKNSDAPNIFAEKGCKVRYISQDKDLRRFSFSVVLSLAKALKDEHVDILHCHRHKATVYGAAAAWLAGVPVVISQVHGLGRTRNLRRRLLNYILFKRINKILTVGKAVKNDVLASNPGMPDCKVEFEGNSIDYEPFINVKLSKSEAKAKLSLPPEAFVYGTVGRLVPTKGQEYLIKAFASVKRTVPAAHLVFAGDGRLLTDLQNAAARTGANGCIHFLGRRSDVPELLQAMDVFMLPSVAEGMPRSLLEAMAAGIPCVATDVGGIPEIIDDGTSGLLVPPKDADSLASAMIKMAQLAPSQRDDMIAAARQKVMQCFTHEIITKRLERIYEEEFSKVAVARKHG